ncbi:hypothetical protein J2W24_004187 [Variovorax boronicumulans]|uniref:reverse transcriptase domain-containing protein n=1 Tax=Variovorax boronicumulans TaxID=436515 RepID=UPI00278802F1|nr:reverse transcriptase domain-containing protein [Variovorax boronicumulans]MDP9918527.1 hypothetical protein [Variovorax boronicumulans]
MNPKWSSRFELKHPGSGKWVFVPTTASIEAGEKIRKLIANRWKVPPYYYHLRAGGHVEALRAHLRHSHFLHIDIKDFFGSINRSRVGRALREYVQHEEAREMANASTVRDPADKNRYFLPYGFVQSPMVASLCLSKSRLGTYLDNLHAMDGVSLSVYVDDIIISSDDPKVCTSILSELGAAAEKANFTLNEAKQQGPAPVITAFNIVLEHAGMRVDEPRLQAFAVKLKEPTSQSQRAGIISYVKSVSPEQGAALADDSPA